MKSRILIIPGVILAAVLISSSLYSWSFFKDNEESALPADVSEITWEDLIPADFVPPENPYMKMSVQEIDKLMDGSEESNAIVEELNKKLAYAPVVPELDGQRVKFPAYITPLEYNEQSTLKEFLLVPFVGACIHVPPPPANQIVHAKTEKGIKSKGMYEAVWATGVIRTETVKSALAESGYRLEVETIKPYTQQ